MTDAGTDAVADHKAGNYPLVVQAAPPLLAAAPQLRSTAPSSTAFVEQINPLGPIEEFIVWDLSRSAARAREYEAALDALRCEAENALAGVLPSDTSGTSSGALTASVLASEKCESLLRQGLAASRGFFRALGELREVRAAQAEPHSALRPDRRFGSEQRCVVYLARRYFQGRCACPRCGAISAGSLIAARAAWQCAGCRTQTGLRRGTCMERSAVPLTKWFLAIRILLLWPTMTTRELAAALGISRQQTVRGMAHRIHAARQGPEPSIALAGLDELYLGFG